MPEHSPSNESGIVGILQSLPDCKVNGKVWAVTALRSNLGLTVKLLFVGSLTVGNPVFDGVFLESPDVP